MQLALSLTTFDPRPTVRRSDPSSSVIVAVERAESGRAAHEAEVVLRCLRQFRGATSAELAHWTRDVGMREFGQSPDEWYHTCSRRLPGLEDRKLVEAVTASFKTSRPLRRVDRDLAPCTVNKSPHGNPLKSLRWYALEVA